MQETLSRFLSALIFLDVQFYGHLDLDLSTDRGGSRSGRSKVRPERVYTSPGCNTGLTGLHSTPGRQCWVFESGGSHCSSRRSSPAPNGEHIRTRAGWILRWQLLPLTGDFIVLTLFYFSCWDGDSDVTARSLNIGCYSYSSIYTRCDVWADLWARSR